MSELPAIFNTEMVQAILRGNKTSTRRPIKLPSHKTFKYHGVVKHSVTKKNVGKCFFESMIDDDNLYIRAPYQTGDIVYVRETWSHYACSGQELSYTAYRANYPYMVNDDGEELEIKADAFKWKPSIHMPKDLARIFLKVNNVRVERVQDINYGEALKEGMIHDSLTPKANFRDLWNLLYNNWGSNPWVWVIDFEVIKK